VKLNYLTDVLTVAALILSLPPIRAQQQDSDLSNPTALAFDSSGNLFVASYPNTIIKFSADGTKSTFAASVLGSSGLPFDNAGNLFVGDLSSQSIIKFAPNGGKTTFVAGIAGPAGLAFDKAGNLFVSDQSTNSIFKFAPDGAKTVFYKGPSQPSAAEEEKDSSAGLPEKYAKNYLIASGTISRDEKFAVIYPTKDDYEFPGGANYVVSRKPFAVLGKLNTKWPYFKNESHGGLNADWSDDGSVALITLDGKWGPPDIFLVEFRDGKVSRMTNILAKARDLLLPDYRKAKAGHYNEYFDFIFESEDNPICKLDGTEHVRINALATTDPKGGGDERVWEGRLKATWDIAQAKFTSQKITRVFAGIRKHED
jgi:hypothetical protein